MQNIGYVIDKRNNAKIKILWRKGKKIDKFNYHMNFKLRKTGSDGNHFIDEEFFLNENYPLLDYLIFFLK